MRTKALLFDQPTRNWRRRTAELALKKQPSLAHKIVFVEARLLHQDVERVSRCGAATLIDTLRLDWPLGRIGAWYNAVNVWWELHKHPPP
jgi:hypothetical protein